AVAGIHLSRCDGIAPGGLGCVGHAQWLDGDPQPRRGAGIDSAAAAAAAGVLRTELTRVEPRAAPIIRNQAVSGSRTQPPIMTLPRSPPAAARGTAPRLNRPPPPRTAPAPPAGL